MPIPRILYITWAKYQCGYIERPSPNAYDGRRPGFSLPRRPLAAKPPLWVGCSDVSQEVADHVGRERPERLDPFLVLLPRDLQWAVEVRNRPWLCPQLYEVLRRHGVALAWIDYPRMPLAQYYAQVAEATTADFVYLRLLGDREGIERITTTWDRLVYDRSRQLAAWAETLAGPLQRVARIHVYANNHYAGCGYRTADQLALQLG